MGRKAAPKKGTRRRAGPKSSKSELADLKKRLRMQEASVRELASAFRESLERDAVMLKALGLSAKLKKGEKGVIEGIQRSLIKLEEYLLSTNDRIDNILNALKTHREFLTRINQRVYRSDVKKRMAMELDILKNTLSVMAMNGVDIDPSILKDIEKQGECIRDEKADMSELLKKQDKIVERLKVEMKRFDLESLYSKRKILPGYV